MNTSKKLTIFEGPDGSGKTTMAKALAKETGALYTHLGPFPRVSAGLARLYVEAMLPAVLGYSDVVLDRCWLSEIPYGRAFREGRDRIGDRIRLLERLALRCQTRLILAAPSWATVKRNFEARKGEEYLDRVDQLEQVYDYYLDLAFEPGHHTALPVTTVDPFRTPPGVAAVSAIGEFGHSFPHPVAMASAGNWQGPVLVVGDSFGHIQDSEPLHQWPFGSLANSGCSLWLARQLIKAGISENQLLWINADQLDPFTASRPDLQVMALGKNATKKLYDLGRNDFRSTCHPQVWKRFHSAKDYPLIPILKEMLSNG